MQRIVAENDIFNAISLVGFLLGGLYVRYAAAKLYNEEKGLIADLIGRRFIAVASPHLGMHKFWGLSAHSGRLNENGGKCFRQNGEGVVIKR